MMGKSKDLYLEVFNKVREFYPNWYPMEIMCDFELGFRAAISEMFPLCVITGCWFHFSQAIMKRVNENGLKARYKNDELFRKYIRMIMAIPLLPIDKINETFQELVHLVETENYLGVLNPILPYVYDYWLQTIGASKISVYGKEERTNNQHECFHSHLTQQMNFTKSACNPNVWAFTRGLQEIEHTFAAKLISLESAQPVQFPKKRKWLEHNARLMQAANRLNQEEITPLQFLAIGGHHVGHDYFGDENDAEMIDDPEMIDNPEIINNPENADGNMEDFMNGLIQEEDYEEEIVGLDDL